MELEDGFSVVLPMVVEHRASGLLKVARLSPGDTYGGPLAASGVTDAHLDAIVLWAKRSFGNMTWVMNPHSGSVDTGHYKGSVARSTLVLDLDQGFDVLRSRWSKGHRSAVSQAQRTGMTVRRARDRADWDAYGECYLASTRRWGGSSGAPAQKLLASLSREPQPSTSLLVAEAEGSVVAGAILLSDQHVATYWHAASTDVGLQLRAPTLIIHEAIRAAVDAGQTVFDMGASGGHRGVEQFKLGFRARPLGYSVLVSAGPTLKVLRAARAVKRAVRQKG
jgi:hypothetical protein